MGATTSLPGERVRGGSGAQVISTPAYMLAQNIVEAADGIEEDGQAVARHVTPGHNANGPLRAAVFSSVGERRDQMASPIWSICQQGHADALARRRARCAADGSRLAACCSALSARPAPSSAGRCCRQRIVLWIQVAQGLLVTYAYLYVQLRCPTGAIQRVKPAYPDALGTNKPARCKLHPAGLYCLNMRRFSRGRCTPGLGATHCAGISRAER